MIKLHENGAFLVGGVEIVPENSEAAKAYSASGARKGTMA